MNNFDDIELMLKKYNQEHILKFFDKLKEHEKKKFINQIKNIDFEKMNLLYRNSMIDEDIKSNEISPIKYIDKEELSEITKEEYSKIGIETICKNELAVVTLAGRTRKQASVYRGLKELMN